MPLDSTFDDRDSDPNKPKLNFDLYEGLASNTVNEEVIDFDLVPQQRSSAKRWDSANLGSRKGKKQLLWFLDASFDMDIASALPNTRRTRRGREGTSRKDKERATLAGPKQSRGSNIKEQVREHLKREKEKKKEPPS